MIMEKEKQALPRMFKWRDVCDYWIIGEVTMDE